MNKKIWMFVIPALFALGCDDATTTNTNPDLITTGGNVDIAMGPDMAMAPAAPALGDQLERMGRPTINVAVTNPFNLKESVGMQDATRDAYNKDSDPSKWVANWKNDIRTNLAIYDGADTVCGNQAGADMAKMDPTRYDTLATVLADDRLFVDTTGKTCNLYLGVELAVLGVANMDCGGRTPNYDVVDFTYTAATVGAAPILMGMFPVNDGIPKDPDGTANLTTFPFLDNPVGL